MRKKYLFSIIMFVLITRVYCYASEKSNNNDIKVIIDGYNIEFDNKPIMVNGKVMAELKTLSEHVNAKISWDDKEQKVTIEEFLGNKMILTIGSKKALLNGKEIYFNLEPKIVNDRVFIPLRSFSSHMNGIYSWSPEKNTSDIYFGRG